MNHIYSSLLTLKYENVFEITTEQVYLKLIKHFKQPPSKKVYVGFVLQFKNTYEHYFENCQ